MDAASASSSDTFGDGDVEGDDVLPAGQLLGGYRLEGMISKGGMATVYRAVQLTMDRPVALKVLHPRRLKKPDAVEKFYKEAQLAASLDHPRLAHVYDVGRDEESGLYFYSMELVMARTLTSHVRQQGAMSWERGRDIMVQVAEGMDHAHRRDMIHRDLKPDNILINDDDHVMITDLGLAIDRMAGKQTGSRRLLSLIGTPEFSAPEQLRDPESAVAASDVFSMGCILYYLLTATYPFEGTSLLDLAISVAVDDPPLLPRLTKPVRGVLEVMLAKDSAARPPDAGAVLALLEHHGAQTQRNMTGRVSRGATSVEHTGTVSGRRRRRHRRRR